MDVQWIPQGFRMDFDWISNGEPMDFKWIPFVFLMDFKWMSSGFVTNTSKRFLVDFGWIQLIWSSFGFDTGLQIVSNPWADPLAIHWK